MPTQPDIQQIQSNSNLYEQALSLRFQTFYEAYDLPWSVLFDEHEQNSTHLGLTDANNDLLAYGRLTQLDHEHFKISQMVVRPDDQHKGYGSALLIELMNRATRQHAQSIMLNARLTATGLYEKRGFKSEGQPFLSATTTVPHIRMIYHID